MTVSKPSLLIAACLIVASFATPVFAADLPARAPTIEPADAMSLRDSLTRRGALYAIRAAFDVMEAESIPALLRSDAVAIKNGNLTTDEVRALEDALIAEGSYYIVSLQYVIAVDGAVWPEDKQERTYRLDSLERLAILQRDWLRLVPAHGDLLPVLLEVDRINGWTEGYTNLPPGLDHFSALEEMVEAALDSVMDPEES